MMIMREVWLLVQTVVIIIGDISIVLTATVNYKSILDVKIVIVCVLRLVESQW